MRKSLKSLSFFGIFRVQVKSSPSVCIYRQMNVPLTTKLFRFESLVSLSWRVCERTGVHVKPALAALGDLGIMSRDRKSVV